MVPRCLWARVEGLALWQCSLEESGWGRAHRLGQKKVSVVDEGSGAEPMWRTTLVVGSFSGHSDKQGRGAAVAWRTWWEAGRGPSLGFVEPPSQGGP